ncbi:zinc ribbon domain-containing protein [Methanobrevibacter thaueri]|uniref:zinc ribbon domain-containing protein n=1 Tax=Methanobrevibacter thaueri TaxID=190975 RepID=UPI003869841A|nr:zinc ribbon domain-containing protein [Clostridia bacterium]
MADSKVFRLPEGIDATSVGKEVENFLRSSKNLVTEGTTTPDGYFVQAKEPEGSGWKQLAGMTMAIQVQIVKISDTITVNIGNGKWSDKIGAGAVGMVLFAPLAVTAAVGAYNQKKLPEEIFEHVEKFLLGGGKSVMMNSFGADATKEDEVICPNCHSVNDKNTKFCGNCGSPLTSSCPNCGADVAQGAKFCTECGSPMELPANVCPECGAEVAADMKFCGECGTKIE